MNVIDARQFKELVWQKGRELYREMPWRDEPSPYHVLVSELMLQQTQVARVVPKFEAFMQRFPTIAVLAESSLADVLVMWSGLGYNRRAKFLWQAALEVSLRPDDELPRTCKELRSLPGIGPNTAAAILNYAYEIPTPFIETNIRTVYLHHFFTHHTGVDDTAILKLVESTMDRERVRAWFWALMDYGRHLKASGYGDNHRSRHYRKQDPFPGSMREMRGRIIRELTKQSLQRPALERAVRADQRFAPALKSLHSEGMIDQDEGRWRIALNRR